jgi:hypothetical protein
MKNKFSEEEGTFYERVFCPSHIKVLGLEKPEDRKRTWEEARRGNLKLVITDERGAKIEVEGTRLVSRVLQYLRPYMKMADAGLNELREVEPSRLEKMLNKALQKSKKDLKFMFDDQGNLRGIASTMHEQISWSKVRAIIEGAVKEVCGRVEQPKSFGHFDAEQPFRWTYKLPLQNKNVSAWVGVHAGNNIIKGRSGIHLWSKFRTEREGEGGAPACLNWCGMWSVPLKWFNIDTQRLNNIASMIGAEQVQTLKMAQFHIKPNLERFQGEVTEQLEGMVKAVEAIKVVINKSVHSPLSKSEMRAILTAYQNKVNLPDYIIKQIMDNVREETVWGFSNAISWVRTHGEFKQFRICKDIEDRPLTRTLENIAGEVLSLTPTINDFHQKVGEITLDRLVPKEEQEAVVQATA